MDDIDWEHMPLRKAVIGLLVATDMYDKGVTLLMSATPEVRSLGLDRMVAEKQDQILELIGQLRKVIFRYGLTDEAIKLLETVSKESMN